MTDNDMEALALKIRNGIDNICGGFHYYKDENVLNRSRELLDDIRIYCSTLLQECMTGASEQEQIAIQNFVLEVLKDYMNALEQQDMVLMLDVLDYGLRELLNIYIENDEEDRENESGDF